MTKRALDVLLAALGLALLAPLFAFIALRIRLDTPGPVFFRQQRVGRGGRLFGIHKFRTMRAGDDSGAQITAAGDARITRVGRWLRRGKLDELPQLIDVLKGDMSLVGPRPEVPRYMALYAPDVRAQILSVRPGITGPAALAFRDEERLLAAAKDPERTYIEQIMPIKQRHDLDYVARHGVPGDLRIIVRTLLAVIPAFAGMTKYSLRNGMNHHHAFWPRLSRSLARNAASKSWLPDLPLTALAWLAAFWLRFNFDVPADYRAQAWLTLPIALVCMALGLVLLRVPRQSWRYVSLADVRRIAAGVLLGQVLTTAAVMGLRVDGFPRAVFPIAALLTLVLLLSARAAWRTFTERERAQPLSGQPLLVLGALDQADRALLTMKGVPGWRVAGIVSPQAADTGRSVRGVLVLGAVDQLADIARQQGATAVLLAAPPGAPERRAALLGSAGAGLNLLTLPAADEWLQTGPANSTNAGANAGGLRRVQLEDLLGRAPVQLDMRGLAGLFSGHTVLVTGAGGSIGAELCRQVARFGAARLVCVDQCEYAIYQLEQTLRREHPALQALYYTASVRELDRLRAVATAHQPQVVLHAAAYKHVPLMESHNEIEALRTNVLGTLNAARIAGEVGAGRFVLISTDKAVNPVNVMGASKRLAEQVVQAVAGQYPDTRFVSVRFGNVLGSSGSVVPLFKAQIEQGGPVTVTHPDIVRYFMTIQEAAQLVLQAGLMGESGQICVLDMGEPVRIAELARMMIRLSGKSEQEIPIICTGLRPGEKLFEELLADGETTAPTPHPKLRIAKVPPPRAGLLAQVQPWLDHCGPAPGAALLRAWLREQVPEYVPAR